METKKCICSKEIRDCSIQYTVTAIENHTHTNYRGRWSGSLNISLNLTVLWSTPHTLQGLLDRVKAQQDAGILLDYTHQQVVYVLLQLNNLGVLLRELRLLLHHQGNQLLLGQLGEGPTLHLTWCLRMMEQTESQILAFYHCFQKVNRHMNM